MRLLRLGTLVILLGLGLGTNAGAIQFNNVVSLGDSLFDAGAARSPVVPEHIAARLGAPLTKYAQGGATTATLLSSGQHTTAAANFGAGDLAFLWIGGNDFLAANLLPVVFGNFAFIDAVEANLDTALSTLRAAGMDVVVFDLPDLAETPLVIDLFPSSAANFRAASLEWSTRVEALAASHGAAYVDVFALFEALVANPADFAFLGNLPVLGPTTACQFCVFWDGIHPTRGAQGFLANEAIAAMNAFYDPGGSMPIAPLSTAELALLVGLDVDCADGVDNDGDGKTDFPDDPGCDEDADVSERSPLLPCDDGIDNDSDGRSDFDPATFASPGSVSADPAGSGDPGCRNPLWPLENPQCQNGADDPDLDAGQLDYDAGRSIHGFADPAGPDPQCANQPWKDKETPGCGVGLELLFLLPLPLALRARRGRLVG